MALKARNISGVCMETLCGALQMEGQEHCAYIELYVREKSKKKGVANAEEIVLIFSCMCVPLGCWLGGWLIA